jgi:hypothetical protein
MRFTKPIAATLALTVAALAFAGPAEARHRHRHGDAFAAGILGFTAGAILSGAFSQPRYYYDRRYYDRRYYAEPVYVAPPPPVVYDTAPAYYYERPEPWSRDWFESCDARYQSFNPRTGYFLGYDGDYHFCY